jgi:hypothetical protein
MHLRLHATLRHHPTVRHHLRSAAVHRYIATRHAILRFIEHLPYFCFFGRVGRPRRRLRAPAGMDLLLYVR